MLPSLVQTLHSHSRYGRVYSLSFWAAPLSPWLSALLTLLGATGINDQRSDVAPAVVPGVRVVALVASPELLDKFARCRFVGSYGRERGQG